MRLDELFQKGGKGIRPWELEIGDPGEYLYTFDLGEEDPTGDVFYDLTIETVDPYDPRFNEYKSFDKKVDPWEIVFTYNTSDGKQHEGIVGTGDAIKVFATIIDIIRSFIQKEHPKGFVFAGKEKSRHKLYDRLAKMLAREIGGKVLTSMKPYGKEYLIVK